MCEYYLFQDSDGCHIKIYGTELLRFFALKLSSSGWSHVGLLFTNEGQKSWLMMSWALALHVLALFMKLQTKAARHKLAVLTYIIICQFHMLMFNKSDPKINWETCFYFIPFDENCGVSSLDVPFKITFSWHLPLHNHFCVNETIIKNHPLLETTVVSFLEWSSKMLCCTHCDSYTCLPFCSVYHWCASIKSKHCDSCSCLPFCNVYHYH